MRNFDRGKYEKLYNWLYYNKAEEGCKCKTCELVPSLIHHKYANKWSNVALRSLPDHSIQF